MRAPPDQFDDPSLKAAIKKIEGGHKARPELRDLLTKRLAEQRQSQGSSEPSEEAPVEDPRPPIRLPNHNPFRIGRWLAIAAAVLICIGGGWGYHHWRQIQEEREEYAKNDALLDAMIDVQNDGIAGDKDDKPLSAAMTEPVALASEATQKLNRPVPVVDLKNAGWTMDAAALCEVQKSPSVRFHFTRGKQTLTLLSMPAALYAGAAEGKSYELVADGHPIAGYIKGGSLNCIVADTTLDPKEAASLRDQIRRG